MAIKAAVALINRKSTFDAGITSLLDFVATKAAAQAACDRAGQGSAVSAEEQDELIKAVSRAMLLCKTRYSSPVYWKRVLDLVHACAPLVPSHHQTLDAYARDIGEFLTHADPDAPPQPQPTAPFLFEGQLSEEPDHARSGLGALYHLERQLLSAAQPEDAADDTGASGQTMPRLGLSQEALQQLLELASQLALFTTEDADEAWALDPHRPRPASKKVVKDMRRLKLSEEALSRLGATRMECPVCMEGYTAGHTVVIMPCSGKHVFHPACLEPWLASNNSCPMCRHELPTDDEAYERHRAREQREAEAREGADNAVRGGETMYM